MRFPYLFFIIVSRHPVSKRSQYSQILSSPFKSSNHFYLGRTVETINSAKIASQSFRGLDSRSAPQILLRRYKLIANNQDICEKLRHAPRLSLCVSVREETT